MNATDCERLIDPTFRELHGRLIDAMQSGRSDLAYAFARLIGHIAVYLEGK